MRTLPRAILARGARALWLCCSIAVACSSDSEAALAELERLAFVPPGECVLQGRSGPRVVCSNERALLVDRFEVTRAAWRSSLSRDVDPTFRDHLAGWTEETENWPASFMTLEEARAFAESRGMRLLTAREWIRVACGTRALPYPWGATEASSVANTLNLGIGHPLPVGTFEQGRTPLSTFDMIGNVWEWVEEPILVNEESPPSLAWSMGGAYLSRLRRLYDLDRDTGGLVLDEQDLDPRTRAIDVGLRCAADAETYLSTKASHLGERDERDRLLRIGASWGRDAVPLLERLSRTPGVAPALGLLLEGARR